jgi:hypothetical protein
MNGQPPQVENETLRKENATLKADLEQARRENLLLRQKLDALARRMFGKKSEQLNQAQLELLLAGLSRLEAQPAPTQPKLPGLLAPRSQPSAASGCSRPRIWKWCAR